MKALRTATLLFFTATLMLFLFPSPPVRAQYHGAGYYGTGYYRTGYYSSPYYTYSYPSYYGYGTAYYTPSYSYCAPQPASQPVLTATVVPQPVPAESTTDRLLKALLLRKLLVEAGMGPPAPPPPPVQTTTSGATPLTAEELAQLRDLLAALKAKAAEKPPEKKE
jgi:hypothetical protein